ncbi:autoinducer binding domain-containing protein [uncultured Roseobacter sp.]|uniref:autoinducer binding domain-containing protein n=1 Tax=uncultured Roseobacter sp. TaxID=114847 RepID=UPI0026022A50|nr:autoinducer binding domain-containing protein [uncultured Roseobacter sp.]
MSQWDRALLGDAAKKKDANQEHVRSGLKRIVDIIEKSELLQFRSTEMEEIANELSCCTDMLELSRLIWRTTMDIGFQDFSLFVLRQGQEPIFRSRWCSSYGAVWLERYQTKSYQFVDPVYVFASVHDCSFLFSEADKNSPSAKGFWSDAKRYGVGVNGFCFVETRPSGARLGISFSTNRSTDVVEELYQLNKFDLQAIVKLAVECFCYVSRGGAGLDNPLSAEELRFLHILATNPKPEKAQLVEPKYGGNKALQASIRSKLKVETVFQAVAMASKLQWFDALPFNCDEVIRPYPELNGWDAVDKINKRFATSS